MTDADADLAAADGSPLSTPLPWTGEKLDRRFELLEALILALATVFTAWAAFQSTKWSGIQADSYSTASAARTEASRAGVAAGQQTIVDVITFTTWLDAISAEERSGETNGFDPGGGYTPVSTALSGFLHERFRDEFKVAVDAWIAAKPFVDPDAPATPFAMAEYRLANDDASVELERKADAATAKARDANQTGDNYVLMTILFASVLFFIGISSKMDTLRARLLLLGIGTSLLVVAAIVVLSFPKAL